MHRKIELWIVWITAVISILLMGGFAMIMNRLTKTQYNEMIVPSFGDTVKDMSVEEGIEIFQTLGAWFGVTVIIMLVLSVLGTFFLVSRKSPLAGSVFFILAGIILLLGSQLVAFIPAFPFFVSGLLALSDYVAERKEN